MTILCNNNELCKNRERSGLNRQRNKILDTQISTLFSSGNTFHVSFVMSIYPLKKRAYRRNFVRFAFEARRSHRRALNSKQVNGNSTLPCSGVSRPGPAGRTRRTSGPRPSHLDLPRLFRFCFYFVRFEGLLAAPKSE